MRLRMSIIGLIVLAYVPVDGSIADEIAFYVAQDGNDHWSGRSDSRPFRSLQAAFDAVAQLRQQGRVSGPVTIYLTEGAHLLDRPVLIGPQHSGSEAYPVKICPYQGQMPVLSGGRRITGWRQVQIDGKRLWAADVPWASQVGSFHQLWVNGQRATRARFPNSGYLRVAGVPDANDKTPWNQGQRRFCFRSGDLLSWGSLSDAEAIVMNRWTESHLPVHSLDYGNRTITSSKRSVFRLEQDDPYYLEHAFAFLDTPGEWFLDRSSNVLYYMPRPGESTDTIEAIAPVLTQLVRMVGDPAAGKYVEHILWQGITFSHTEWYFPADFRPNWPSADIAGFPQAAIGVPGAVYGQGVRYCRFEQCNFTHIGTYCLELSKACKDNTIDNCRFSDVGAGGIKIGEEQARQGQAEHTHGNKIANCIITDAGKVFHGAVGIWIGQSYDNTISHNEISDLYYTGISIGWTWGYGPSLAGGNIVEFNHVHHIGRRADGDGPILSDMGGIYTLGTQKGTIIRNNLWHDIAGLRYGGWGIYLDEGSSDILVENNLVYNTTHGGFHQHYGKDNTIRNNIFCYGRDHQIQATRPEGHLRFRFVGNIVVGHTERFLVGGIDSNMSFERNLYWRDGGPIRFGDLTWHDWQARGMDNGSVIADPLFTNPGLNDFTLRPDSPALKLGFQPYDLGQVGPSKQQSACLGPCSDGWMVLAVFP